MFKRYLVILLLSTGVLVLLTSFSGSDICHSNCSTVFLPVHDSLPELDTASRIFMEVEKEAYFPGGDQAWFRFLEQNLNPNTPVDNGAPPGTYTVMIQFVVSIDGKISNIKPLTKHGYGMEAEVMRILRKSPPWVPAIQFGRNVNAFRKQPVTFQITVEKGRRKKGRS